GSGQVAELSPILMSTACLPCHGDENHLIPALNEPLHRLYPDDQATGFEEGEVRGYFWAQSTP
ncbi:MAG: DUF3365 domain-containing protein, partial [Myxococcales bacterium]|nr:DUF3365 domain-containing protein [Myxococcales bacterium]